MIGYDTVYPMFTCTQKLTYIASLICRTELINKKSNGIQTKSRNEMLRYGPVIKSVEKVLRPEGSLWWERFVKEVGFEPGAKDRRSY